MVFLHPAFLWGLAFLAVPIAVHLLNFRRPRRLLFSQVAFLSAISQVVARRLKLKRRLLLAIRLLGVLLAVLAFAGPVLRPKNTVNVGGFRSVLLVVDNSYSMHQTDGKGLYLQQARDKALALVRALGPAAEYQVQPLSRLQPFAPFVAAREAGSNIEGLDYGQGATSLAALVKALPRLFSEARGQRWVYVVSDFQRSTVLADSLGKALPPGTELVLLPIGLGTQPNVVADSLALANEIREAGQAVSLKFRLNNFSTAENPAVHIRADVNGRAVASLSERLQPQQQKEITLSFQPPAENKGGKDWVAVQLTLDDSPIDFDNTLYFAFHLPQRPKILLVEGPTPSPYLDALLSELNPRMETVRVAEKGFAEAELTAYNEVILLGTSSISSGQAARLQQYIKGGGGLLFFPDAQMDVSAVNSCYRQLGLGAFSELKHFAVPMPTAQPDLKDPLFAHVFEPPQPKARFDGPLVKQLYGFTLGNSLVQHTVMSTTGQDALLLEQELGAGRVFTFTLFPDLTWSDLPTGRSFAPLIYRVLLRLAMPVEQRLALELGNPDERLQLVPTQSIALVTLKPTKGEAVIPVQHPREGGVLLDYGHTELTPGIYEVRQGDSLLAVVAFNLPVAESKLGVAGVGELRQRLAAAGFKAEVLDGPPGAVQEAVRLSVLGTPLWKLALIGGLVCLVAEGLIAGLWRE